MSFQHGLDVVIDNIWQRVFARKYRHGLVHALALRATESGKSPVAQSGVCEKYQLTVWEIGMHVHSLIV